MSALLVSGFTGRQPDVIEHSTAPISEKTDPAFRLRVYTKPDRSSSEVRYQLRLTQTGPSASMKPGSTPEGHMRRNYTSPSESEHVPHASYPQGPPHRSGRVVIQPVSPPTGDPRDAPLGALRQAEPQPLESMLFGAPQGPLKTRSQKKKRTLSVY
jgi:hypothetical protein